MADLDFSDIALLSDSIQQARELLFPVETECIKVGLVFNGPKTKYLTCNIDDFLLSSDTRSLHHA